jgi:hypothetical protein
MDKNKIKETAENVAYQIVCKMIDSGFVESEPEGQGWEHEISQIIEEKFAFLENSSYLCDNKNKGNMKATNFYLKLRRLEDEIKTDIVSRIIATGATTVEFTGAEDDKVDWCDKVTVDYEDDFTGEVRSHIVKSVSVVGGKLYIQMIEPEYSDAVNVWGSDLFVDSLVTIHTAVCKELGIEISED